MQVTLRCMGIPDPSRRWDRVPRSSPPQQQTNVLDELGLYCSVKEELLEHVLLCVAAAQLIHVIKPRLHQSNGAGMLAALMRQYGLADGHRHAPDDLRNRSITAAERAHLLEHPFRRVIPSSRRQRHDPVPQGECAPAITCALLGLV